MGAATTAVSRGLSDHLFRSLGHWSSGACQCCVHTSTGYGVHGFAFSWVGCLRRMGNEPPSYRSGSDRRPFPQRTHGSLWVGQAFGVPRA